MKTMKEKETDVKKVIKDLAKSYGDSNEEQGKMVNLMKGLAFSDDEEANRFMKALDKWTTEYAEKNIEENVEESIIEIKEEVQIGDVVLEEGDKIRVITERIYDTYREVYPILNNYIGQYFTFSIDPSFQPLEKGPFFFMTPDYENVTFTEDDVVKLIRAQEDELKFKNSDGIEINFQPHAGDYVEIYAGDKIIFHINSPGTQTFHKHKERPYDIIAYFV